jgi:putative transposase
MLIYFFEYLRNRLHYCPLDKEVNMKVGFHSAMTEQPHLLPTLSEDQRAQALERFVILRPTLEEGVPQTQIARMYDLPLSTVQRWIKHYRERGLVGLARQPRSDRGKPRGMPSKLAQFIEGLALRMPPRSVTAIHHRVTEVAKQKGWKPPSYSRVYQIVRFARESYDMLEPPKRNYFI